MRVLALTLLLASFLLTHPCDAVEDESSVNSERSETLESKCALRSSSTVSVTTDEVGDVTIVSPTTHSENNDVPILDAWSKENQADIRRCIFQKGGLLFREWNIANVTDAESIIFDSIGLQPMEQFPEIFLEFNVRAKELGVPPGGLTQTKLSRNVPVAHVGNMQPPHVEFGLGPYRPRVVGFFAEVPPAAGGSTGRVYFPDAVRQLSPEFYQLLQENGWYMPQAGVVQPSLMVHPETGRKTLQLYSFSKKLASVAHQAYREVREAQRPDLPQVLEILITETQGNTVDYTLELVRPNGTIFEMPHHFQLEYYRAMFTTLRLQHWRKGDLLLFDNLLYGHMRMPGEQPRKLHAIFAEEVDSRNYRPANSPRCVQEGAKQPAVGSTQVLLNQLGPGGNMWLLWFLCQMPDIVFQVCGNLLWADGGFSGAFHALSRWFWGSGNSTDTDEGEL